MKKFKVIKPYRELKEFEILTEGYELYHTKPMEFRNNSVLYFKKEEIENNKEYFELVNENCMTQEQKNALRIVLDFVERWNKKDEKIMVAGASVILEEFFKINP